MKKVFVRIIHNETHEVYISQDYYYLKKSEFIRTLKKFIKLNKISNYRLLINDADIIL